MANKLWPKNSVTAPGILRAEQLPPDSPVVNFNIYGSNPQPSTGGPTAPPTFIPSVPTGAPQAPMVGLYPGGIPVADPVELATLRNLHAHMLYMDPLSAQPLTDEEVSALKDHAASGCSACNGYLAGARRGAAGVTVRIRRQKAAEAAAARKRR